MGFSELTGSLGIDYNVFLPPPLSDILGLICTFDLTCYYSVSFFSIGVGAEQKKLIGNILIKITKVLPIKA